MKAGGAEVMKTYKLFVGGAFPRSESGHSYRPAGNPSRNAPRGSRKDLRDAVEAAQAGKVTWRKASGYLRGQILYRLAEMLESRRAALADELQLGGAARAAATREVQEAIALCVWYAGLCDKLPALLGSQNAVNGPFHVFSNVEPTGVVAAIAPPHAPLLGLLAVLLPPLCAGNTVIGVVSEPAPFAGLALGEALATSDVPAGAVNLLSGPARDLAAVAAAHRAIDGMLLAGRPDAPIGAAAADSCKRVRWRDRPAPAWRRAADLQSLLWVEPFVEIKTVWHPIAP